LRDEPESGVTGGEFGEDELPQREPLRPRRISPGDEMAQLRRGDPVAFRRAEQQVIEICIIQTGIENLV
jgi:hypothetical protein